MNKIIDIKHNWKLVSVFSLIFVLAIWRFGAVVLFKLGLICLPFLFLFVAILKSNTIALWLIFTTAFTRVIFHLVGLPRAVPTLFTELCILLLLTKALYVRLIIQQKPMRAIGFFPMLGIFVISVFSYLMNTPGVLPAIFFLRKTFIFYLFFIAVLNLDLSHATITKVNRYILFLFFIQIPASLVKLFLIGQEEGRGIGTVSWHAGALSTTLPLFAISFLLSFYFFKRNVKYIALIMGFIAFGLIGEKRAILFLFPVVTMIVAYFYGKNVYSSGLFGKVLRFKYLFFVIVASLIGLFAAFHMMTPDLTITFNPAERYKGSNKIKYVIDYIVSYNTRAYRNDLDINDAQNTMGRARITMVVLRKLLESGTGRLLLGFGPGCMISSPHLDAQDQPFRKFGIRGAMTGFIKFVLQTGVLGVVFLTYFLVKLLQNAYHKYRESHDYIYKMVALGFIGATFVFLLDFFVYSVSTLYLGVLTPVYFYVAAIILRKDLQNYQILKPSQL